jgi:CRISPR-associated protein Cas2
VAIWTGIRHSPGVEQLLPGFLAREGNVLVVVSYDVSTVELDGRRRLHRIARACQSYGDRVQKSVFECELDPAGWARLKHRLLAEYDPSEDSLRFYFLGSDWDRRVEHCGVKRGFEPKETLFV